MYNIVLFLTVVHLAGESLLSGLPVDHIPDGTKVFGLAVLILQIVLSKGQRESSQRVIMSREKTPYSVFPSIHTQQRLELSNDGILVGISLDRNVSSLSILDQPSPARTLDAGQSSIELLLQLLQIAVRRINGFGQLSRRGLTTALVLWCQVLPEQGVVEMATTVEVDDRKEGNFRLDVVAGFCSCELVGCVVV